MSGQSDELTSNYHAFRPEGRTRQADGNRGYMLANILPMIAALNLPRTARILEIGPGQGHLLDLLREQGYLSLEGFDLCDDYRAELRAKGYPSHEAASLGELLQGLADGSYDLVLAVDVLEHIERRELSRALSMLRNKLKRGGHLIGQVPNSSGLFGHTTFVADLTHVTAFNEISLSALFRGCGYTDIVVLATRLPSGFANRVRSLLRALIFRGCYLLMRICGATPVQHLTHLLRFRVSA